MVDFDWYPFEEDENRIRKIMRRMMRTMWRPMQEIRFETFPVDLSDAGDELILKADLPGFERGDIKVHVIDDRVDISAKREKKVVKETETMYSSERRAGAVRRAMTLPETVDPDKVQAEFKNGVLTLRMKKKKTRKGKEIRL